MTGQLLLAKLVYGFAGETPVDLAYLGPGAGLAGHRCTVHHDGGGRLRFVWYPLQRLWVAYAIGSGKPPNRFLHRMVFSSIPVQNVVSP